jgi:lysozyme family protein
MADFNKAIAHLLQVEGGYVNDSSDPGGATNFGISLRFLKDHVGDANILKLTDYDHDGDLDANDIRHLTKEAAAQVYRIEFWDKYQYDRFYDLTAIKLFDMSVNMGPTQAHKIFQKALNTFTVKNNRVLIIDGQLGPNSFNKFSQVVIQYSESQLLDAIRIQQMDFYTTLVIQKPELAKFLVGWKNRVYSV